MNMEKHESSQLYPMLDWILQALRLLIITCKHCTIDASKLKFVMMKGQEYVVHVPRDTALIGIHA